ncbi:hypothetical protein K466DRAFT_582712 [Polyporus arcularius HHB13444]|uniref:Ubiquitin 3 binding protein But2 C-terminal domain-containing protein n=1 Tax=Polyporus arcularius HHB13444 TaxID=1314778 RepID=A0A5C3PQ92_9APHY|nr:hypothetical protein K466DRAFT_582712 [Polyporus arcularius HHB13444]
MPPYGTYSRLPSAPTATSDPDCTVEQFEYEDTATLQHATGAIGRVSETTAWNAFVWSCIGVLVLSSINLAFLSTSTTLRLAQDTLSPARSPNTLKRPSVYLGLENVVFEPSYCRSRGTFPKTFYTYDARDGPRAELQHLHAPDDKMSLTFGGPIHAVVDTYIPDYGLENCTLQLRRMSPSHPTTDRPHTTRAFNIDIYLLPSLNPADRARRVHIDMLSFAIGKESASKPFFCPSRSHVFFEWVCASDECESQISIPLEGVTSLTASAESLTKTGFTVTQYESLKCIDTSA